MKGKLTIDATEQGLHISGEMLFKHYEERFEIIRTLSLSMGINTPEKWAELVVHCLPRLNDKGRRSSTIEIKIPIKGDCSDDGKDHN